MKVRLSFLVPGVILVLLGLLWFLQGIGLVRGSFMTGQILWLVVGVVVALAGLGLSYAGLTPAIRRG